MSRYILGVTGASGAIYAARLAMYLKYFGHNVTAIVTKTAKEVIEFEQQNEIYDFCDELLDIDSFFEECASGSANFSGMAIVPCSMGTLGRIAAGTSDNLLVRAADVCLKERRTLVVVPREMPYNAIHLKNMSLLTQAGAIIVAASPHFYNKPLTICELVDTVVAKILLHLGVDSAKNICKPWTGKR